MTSSGLLTGLKIVSGVVLVSIVAFNLTTKRFESSKSPASTVEKCIHGNALSAGYQTESIPLPKGLSVVVNDPAVTDIAHLLATFDLIEGEGNTSIKDLDNQLPIWKSPAFRYAMLKGC